MCSSDLVPVEILRRLGNVAVAEQAFTLLAALAKQVCEFNGVVTAGALAERGFAARPRSPFIGYSNPAGIPGLRTLHGATLGIIGFGEVGRDVARYARAFEMNVLYFQRSRLGASEEAQLGVRHATLGELMAASDYVVVQLPLNESTRGLLERVELAMAKPGQMIVNVARAELIDHVALVEAIDSGRIGGFALDVGYSEPTAPDEPLLAFRRGNVILMPHTAIGARQNALADMQTLCVNLWRRVCAPS